MDTLQIVLAVIWVLCAALIGYSSGYRRGMERTYQLLTEALDEVHKAEMSMLERNNNGSD